MRFVPAMVALSLVVAYSVNCGPRKGSHDEEGPPPATNEPPTTMGASGSGLASRPNCYGR